MNTSWSQCQFLVIDVEGNGQQPLEIIELAIVTISGGRLDTKVNEWLIKPALPVTSMASRLHGIYNDDLVHMPSFKSLSSEISSILRNEVVIGHNVGVDVQLLRKGLPSWTPLVAIDTLRLAKSVNPGLSSYGLEFLLDYFNVELQDRKAHRALSDAIATAQLFLTLVEILEKRSAVDLMTLAEIGASPNDPYFKSTQQSLF